MCLHSCGLVVRRTAFEEVGGFDESFDFLDADTDFSLRLRKAGWRLAKSDDLVAYHEGGGSPQSTAKRVLRHHRSRWQLLEKHGKLTRPLLTRLLLLLRHALELAALRLTGPLLASDPRVRADKLAGRRALVRCAWQAYRS
jgi:GT2 family glycosyltransferase